MYKKGTRAWLYSSRLHIGGNSRDVDSIYTRSNRNGTPLSTPPSVSTARSWARTSSLRYGVVSSPGGYRRLSVRDSP